MALTLSTFAEGTIDLPGTGAVQLLAPAVQASHVAMTFFVAAAARHQHTQAAPATEWVINHNLGAWPTARVYTPGLVEIEAEIVHTSPNQTRIRFNTAQAGIAVLH